MTLAEHIEHADIYGELHLIIPEPHEALDDPEGLYEEQKAFAAATDGVTGWALMPRDEQATMAMMLTGLAPFEPDEPFSVAIPDGLQYGGDGEGSGQVLIDSGELTVLPTPSEETH